MNYIETITYIATTTTGSTTATTTALYSSPFLLFIFVLDVIGVSLIVIAVYLFYRKK